ncbi:hypothetical protein HK405_013264, partial [Cladochytrium tenue]
PRSLLLRAGFPDWEAARLAGRSVADMLLLTPGELAAVGLDEPTLLERFRAIVQAVQEARWEGAGRKPGQRLR